MKEQLIFPYETDSSYLILCSIRIKKDTHIITA